MGRLGFEVVAVVSAAQVLVDSNVVVAAAAVALAVMLWLVAVALDVVAVVITVSVAVFVVMASPSTGLISMLAGRPTVVMVVVAVVGVVVRLEAALGAPIGFVVSVVAVPVGALPVEFLLFPSKNASDSTTIISPSFSSEAVVAASVEKLNEGGSR
jgi:hypothetical protein